MTQNQILDLVEKAFDAGCFKEVLKMIRAGSDVILINKVIEKSKLSNNIDDLWKDIFGTD